MKKIVSLILILTLALAAPAAAFATDYNTVEAEAYLMIDMATGQVLCEKNADKTMYPASITKILTAIIVLESLPLDQVVTIDAEADAATGNSGEIVAGEKLTVEQLLRTMLVISGNDCAVALAKATAGSVANFAVLMNTKARELGATHSNFVNPNGLPNNNHYTTARDIITIAQYCMQNELFREMVSTAEYDLPATDKAPARHFETTNFMLKDGHGEETQIIVNNRYRSCEYEGTIGIKTGLTNAAGSCLLSAVERGDSSFMCVVLKSNELGRFADSIALYEWAFKNFRSLKVIKTGQELGTVRVSHGEFNKVSALADATVAVTLPPEASDSIITTEVKLDSKVSAPIEQGQKLGSIDIYEGGKLIGTYDAVAASSVGTGGLLSYIGIPDRVAKILFTVFISAAIAFLLIMTAYVILKRRQIKRKKALKAAKLKARQQEEERRRIEWERYYGTRYTGQRKPPEDDEWRYR